MATQTTASTGITSQFQKYMDEQLLLHATPLLAMADLGQKRPLPKNKGAKTIRFHKRSGPDRTKVMTGGVTSGFDEGVTTWTGTAGNFREITLNPVDATLELFGEATRISDLLGMTDLFDTMEQSVQLMGEDCASAADFHVMDEVVTNVASGNKRYSGGATDFASLDALTNANGKIVIKDLLGAMTRLTITRAPKPKGGEYVAVVAPQVAYDIMDDPKFVDAGVRGTIKGLFTGELGVWYFTRIVKTTQPWIEETAGGEGVYDSTGDIFSTVVVGREAFGVPNLQGNSPLKPSTIIVNTPDSGNPLNQYVTAGWKAYWTAKVLDDTWFVVLRSRSTYTP